MNYIVDLPILLEGRERLQFDQAPDALLVYDMEASRFVDANPAAARLFECSTDELLQCGPETFHVGYGPRAGRGADAPVTDPAGESMMQEVVLRTAAGRQRRCELRLLRLAGAQRHLVRVSYIDITARREAQVELDASPSQLAELADHRQAILDNVLEAIITSDAAGKISSFNRAATQIFGFAPDEVIGRNVSMLMPEREASQHDRYMANHATTRQPRVIGVGRETQGRHKSGRIFPIHLALSAIEHDGEMTYVALIRDLSEQKEAEAHIERLAYYDALTGLPNRRLLIDQVRQVQRHLAHEGGHAVLVCADIDQFKSLNNTLGHAAGDALLREAGRHFAECVQGQGLAARLGADEFGLLIEGLDGDEAVARQQATAWCQTLLQLARRQHGLFDHDYRTSASLGALLISSNRESPEALLAQADLALHLAKSESRDTYRFYDPEMGRAAARRAALLNDLRLALPRDELALLYQPQVGEHGELLGAEALLRWHHPQRGLVSPADFIPLAEQSGFIIEIGQWVLQRACETLARWRRDPRTEALSLAINISATEFRDPEFLPAVSRVLAVSGADPRRLKLELTESVLAADLGDLSRKLAALKRLGLSLALDDFGTGYSSMAYLRELPLDQLKIDRSFIVEIDNNPRDAVLVRGMVEMCKLLGLAVIAEGVETEAQHQRLLACGCRCFQGYLTGRPMSADDLRARAVSQACEET